MAYDSCLVGDTVFSRTDVRTDLGTEKRVTIVADVLTGCDIVKGVRVVFISPRGNVSYDLLAQGYSRFMHRPEMYEFPVFELDTEVEFQALDASGKIVGTQIHKMSQSLPRNPF